MIHFLNLDDRGIPPAQVVELEGDDVADRGGGGDGVAVLLQAGVGQLGRLGAVLLQQLHVGAVDPLVRDLGGAERSIVS